MLLAAVASGCVDDPGACTEIGCDDQIVITFSQSPGSAYWFEVDGDGVLLPCNVPDAEIPPKAAFSYECGDLGISLAAPSKPRYSISLSIYEVDSLAPIVESKNVSLSVSPDAEPLAPNGIDCPPVCYERFGTLL